MAKFETMTIPSFVKNPNTMNGWAEFQEESNPFDSSNGELVEKKDVKNVSAKSIHKLLSKLDKGIL